MLDGPWAAYAGDPPALSGAGEANSLRARLDAAARPLERGNTTVAEGQLNAFLNEIDAMVRSGRLSAAQVEALREVLGRTLDNLA